MHDTPLVKTGNTMHGVVTQIVGQQWDNPDAPNNSTQVTEESEKTGLFLIRDLWQRGMGIIQNMRVAKTNAFYYLHRNPEKCLHVEKKKKSGSIWRPASINDRFSHPFFVL